MAKKKKNEQQKKSFICRINAATKKPPKKQMALLSYFIKTDINILFFMDNYSYMLLLLFLQMSTESHLLSKME